MVVANISNHKLTAKQIEMIENFFNITVSEVKDCPIGNLPPSTKERFQIVEQILSDIRNLKYIHLNGEAHFVFLLANRILSVGRTVFKFYSERKVTEVVNKDGSVTKTSVFEPKNILLYQ